jgi:hypothetical protein
MCSADDAVVVDRIRKTFGSVDGDRVSQGQHAGMSW